MQKQSKLHDNKKRKEKNNWYMKAKVPSILANTLMRDLCHPLVWVSTLRAQVCTIKAHIKKKTIKS